MACSEYGEEHRDLIRIRGNQRQVGIVQVLLHPAIIVSVAVLLAPAVILLFKRGKQRLLLFALLRFAQVTCIQFV